MSSANKPRLQSYYENEISGSLMKEFELNRMQVPRLEKIVVNIGLGEAIQNPKAIEAACEDIAKITG
jgi:large subunit ribosomal protein L5